MMEACETCGLIIAHSAECQVRLQQLSEERLARAEAAEEKLSFIKTTIVKKLPGAGGNDVLGLVFEILNNHDALVVELIETKTCLDLYVDGVNSEPDPDDIVPRRIRDEAKLILSHPPGTRGKEILAERDRLREAWIDMQTKANFRGGEASDSLFSAERREDTFNIGFYRARRNVWEYLESKAKAALVEAGPEAGENLKS